MEQTGRGRRILGSQDMAQDGVKSSKYDYLAPRSEARSDILPEEQHQSPASSNMQFISTNFNTLLDNKHEIGQNFNPNSNQKVLIQDALDSDTPSEAEARDRAKQYCNPPSFNVSSHEGNVSPSYKLVQVHVVIRHGDRSPMYGVGGIDLKEKLHLDCTLDSVPNMQNNSDFQNYRSTMEAIWQEAQADSTALMYGIYPKEKNMHGCSADRNWCCSASQ